MIKQLIVSLIFATAIAVGAQEQSLRYEGRVSIIGLKDGIALTPGNITGVNGRISNFTWEKDPVKARQGITAIFPATPDWQNATVSFTPDKDGTVLLSFIGAWHQDGTQTWTLFDDIETEGANLKNGSFDQGAADWTLYGAKGLKAELTDDGRNGGKAIKVSHDNGVGQTITVKAGQPVTVSYWFKAVK